jgi:UDP-3-O-[3-hydroxymyristoyl] N-acetylglucosamine deacetylase
LALHAGVPTSIVLASCPGPCVLEQGSIRAPFADLEVARADRGVRVVAAGGALCVDLVEHLMAAVGGLGVRDGLRVTVRGPEVPLLDGGARRMALGLRSIGAGASPRRRRVTCSAAFELGGARYELEPSDSVELEVLVQFDHPLVRGTTARWRGDAEGFLRRVAPARTFGFLSEAAALREVSRARGANPRDVVVLCDDGTTLSDPPPEPDECARHKLLDLIGDLTLSGGVPLGRIRALRPGHAATLEVARRAAERGVIAAEASGHG